MDFKVLLTEIGGFLHGSVLMPFAFAIGVAVNNRRKSHSKGFRRVIFSVAPLVCFIAALVLFFACALWVVQSLAVDHDSKVFLGRNWAKWFLFGMAFFVLQRGIVARFFRHGSINRFFNQLGV